MKKERIEDWEVAENKLKKSRMHNRKILDLFANKIKSSVKH